MAKRPCIEAGCPRLTTRTRCDSCERERDRGRGTRQQRGYDAMHDQVGRDYQAAMDAGRRYACWRCGHPLGTRRGTDWVLGHCDDDRARHHGPEHPACNGATSGRTGCTHPAHSAS